MFEGITCVYRSNIDLFFYVFGSSNENEVDKRPKQEAYMYFLPALFLTLSSSLCSFFPFPLFYSADPGKCSHSSLRRDCHHSQVNTFFHHTFTNILLMAMLTVSLFFALPYLINICILSLHDHIMLPDRGHIRIAPRERKLEIILVRLSIFLPCTFEIFYPPFYHLRLFIFLYCSICPYSETVERASLFEHMDAVLLIIDELVDNG